MELQNIRKIIKKNSNYCIDIMTPWDDVCTNPKNSNENRFYDYIPIMKDNVVSSLLDQVNKKYYDINNNYFINEKDDLISVLEKMNKLYNDNKITFLIVGNANNHLGIINHNDLNNPSFIHIMWDIFYNFEIKLGNYLKDSCSYDKKIDCLKGMDKNIYYRDKKLNQDLEPIFYYSLSNKIKLYNDNNTENKLQIEDIKFRNNMAHPRSKPKVINNKSEIPQLLKSLEDIDKFLS